MTTNATTRDAFIERLTKLLPNSDDPVFIPLIFTTSTLTEEAYSAYVDDYEGAVNLAHYVANRCTPEALEKFAELLNNDNWLWSAINDSTYDLVKEIIPAPTEENI